VRQRLEVQAVLRAATNKGYRVLRCRRRSGLTQPIDIIDKTVVS